MNLFATAWQYFTKTPPIELYKFTLGAESWRYAATYPNDYTYKNEVYKSEYIVRTGLHFSNDPAKDVLTVTLPADNPISHLFFAGTPEYAMRLQVFRGDFGAADLSTIWTGFVNGSSQTFNENTYVCDLTCETIASRMDRRGLARNYQILCPHTLYDHNCRVNKLAWAATVQVTADSSNSYVNVNIAPENNFYAGGYLSTSKGARRFIMSNTAGQLYLERPLQVAKNEAVILYPGCNKSWDNCLNKFHNSMNYGGFRWIPITNPFKSTIG